MNVRINSEETGYLFSKSGGKLMVGPSDCLGAYKSSLNYLVRTDFQGLIQSMKKYNQGINQDDHSK